jgi:2-polyprenyl-3-methyl-5-hydroxy-6-metoxy-1,4-benzoquinol methylase
VTADLAAVDSDSPEARLRRYLVYDEVNAPYVRWQLDQFEPYLGRRVLEVGCGVGAMLAQLGPRDFVMGVDIEPELADFTKKRFGGQPNHQFASLDISSLSVADRSQLKEHNFDTIVCSNVLEHIDDHASAVTTMADLLVPGGVLALLVPAHPALFGPYDVTDGHFRRYTKATLREVVVGANLKIERIYHFNSIGAVGWWVQYRVMRRSDQTQGDYRLMQTLVPFLRAVEKRLKPPIGLSLVAVARKPA